MFRLRSTRIAVRLALAAIVALPAGLALNVAAPAAADAAGCVYFSAVKFNAKGDDSKNLNGEWVKVTNRCSMRDLGGWKVKDKAGNTYRFASPTRMGTGSIYVHTGKGTNRPGHRYWRRSAPVWNNTSETAYLINRSGTVVHKVSKSGTTSSGSTTSAFSVPFGSRPRSGAISLRGCRDRTISNKTFKDLGPGVIAIRLQDCHNVTIKAVDFINVAEGVYALNSTNIKIVDSRYQNIVGPSDRTGANTGNFVQFHSVNGGRVDHNKGKGGDTEDVVSLYKSSNIVVEDNHFEGTNWTSTSSSGIAIGDGGGSNNIARRNKLVNIGQVGIFIAGGRNNTIHGNAIYGAPRNNSNVGIYVRNSTSSTCSGHKVTDNRVRFQKEDGTRSGYWQGSGCGTVTRSGNDWWAPLTYSSMDVHL
jgi:hypothetical protein